MTITKTTTGRIPFSPPHANKPCSTWYKVVGDLSSDAIPLVALHGGPGAGHNYLSPLIDLHTHHESSLSPSNTHDPRRPIIFYDQLGCGRSTHLPEKVDDTSFWTFALFIAELENLLNHLGLHKRGFHLLGHSWGGMLAAVYASSSPPPPGLRKLILSDSPASVPLMMRGVNELVKHLPEDVQRDLDECVKKGEFDSEKYKRACEVFYRKHLCRLETWPGDLEKSLGNLEEDPTVYGTMFGPSEMLATGSLKGWDGKKEARRIKAETLLISGRYDEVQEVAVQPWFEGIRKVKWALLEKSSHTGLWEERERYVDIVRGFLDGEEEE